MRYDVKPRRRFVLFELNEVPLRVGRHFAERHPRSAFARMLAQGRAWTTFTPDEGHLSPWVTWPTLHRGVPNHQHHIVALGQQVGEIDRRFPPVWQLLASAGRRVGMFGSLHSYPPPADLKNYDFYVPDTFAAGPEASSRKLSSFQKFNLSMVARSGRNASADLPLNDALRFLAEAPGMGIKLRTLLKIVRQLASERLVRDRTARRRTIQSLLSFDLFLAQLRRRRPDAAFFFTNHVASSLHRYWPATYREDYRVTDWSASWVKRFSGEIDYTMNEADQMLGQLMDFAQRHPDYLILVAGSMGQAAVDSPERQTKTEVLLRDLNKFLAFLEVSAPCQRRPTMEPTYTLAFEDAAGADQFCAAITRVTVSGEQIPFTRLDAESVEFKLGFPNVPEEDLTVMMGNRQFQPEEAGVANVTIDDEVGAAAYHVPEGMMLVFDPWFEGECGCQEEIVETTRIAPTLLALQGVQAPPHMARPLPQIAAQNGATRVTQRSTAA
jgi:hypothetical protein